MEDFEKVNGEVVTDDEPESWFGFKPKTKFGKFVVRNEGPIIEFLGGLCILTAAILNVNEGNSYVNVVTTDNTVYKVRAKKMKSVKVAEEVKHTSKSVEVSD